MASEDKSKSRGKEPIVIPFSEENEDWLRSSRKNKEEKEAPEKDAKKASIVDVAKRLS
jgi:hypothetical protein